METKNYIKIAYNKGYRIDKKGDVTGLRGNTLSANNKNSLGYNRFAFRLEGKRISVASHRLQAYQKYGDKMFEDGIVVRHLDGNPSNNSWDNIDIGTQRDNMMDKSPEQRRKDASSPKHDHKSIIEDHKNGLSYRDIMNKYNISSKGTVSFIIRKSMFQEEISSM